MAITHFFTTTFLQSLFPNRCFRSHNSQSRATVLCTLLALASFLLNNFDSKLSNCPLCASHKLLKALANEDTLLPTQMLPRLPARAIFVADTNFVSGTQKVFLILYRNILRPQQMFPSLRSMETQHSFLCPARLRAQETSRATMCPQQCVLVYQYLYASVRLLAMKISE